MAHHWHNNEPVLDSQCPHPSADHPFSSDADHPFRNSWEPNPNSDDAGADTTGRAPDTES
jgi:hypothetical protein